MRTLEMKIAIPEVNGGRCILESELECKIDPNIFAGEWLEHKPTTRRQKETLYLYQDAKAKGRLHTFTCMIIDASVIDGKLVYQKGLPIKTGFSQREWAKMLKDYNPSRNSRQMTRTEYACRNLFLIQRLVESGYEIAEAWYAVCDDSKEIGHYCNSYNAKNYAVATAFLWLTRRTTTMRTVTTFMVLVCLRMIKVALTTAFQERDGICFVGSIFKIYRRYAISCGPVVGYNINKNLKTVIIY